MRQRCLKGILLSAFLCRAASAAAPKIAGAAVDSNDRTHIIVDFDNPAPAPAAVNEARFWIVYETTKTMTKRLYVLKVDSSSLKDNKAEKIVDLYLQGTVAKASDGIQSVTLMLVNDTDIVQPSPLTNSNQLGIAVKPAPVLKGAKTKSDSDIYFNGSYAAVVNGDPTYNIDAFAGYMHALNETHPEAGKLGVYGQVTTKSSPVADPNSFLTYIVYQKVLGNSWYGPFQAPIFNYRVFGAEFDRKATQLNLINSPTLTVPVRLGESPDNLSDKITYWPQMNLTMGTEFVDVRKSVLAPVGRWHTRGLVGANYIMGFGPKKPGFESWQFSSSWQLRLPSAAEVFYDDKFAPIDPTTGKKNPKNTPAMLGTQPRHYLDTKVTYNWSSWGGITFEHTYGSLPPAFVKTDHTFTVGLSFTLQQSNFGRTSILRP